MTSDSELAAPSELETVQNTTIPTPKRKKREASLTDSALDTQPLFEQPVIVEGKRSRKPTARLELSDLETPKKELAIPQGHGRALGDIPFVDYQLNEASNELLASLGSVCFGRRINKSNLREHLRDFNGFEFKRDSEEYQRHLSTLAKLKKDQLQSLSDLLGLPSSNSTAEAILNFLFEPIDDGKAVPSPQKMSMRTSTKSRESIPIDDDLENGDDDDEVEDDDETDDDYVGSDEKSSPNYRDEEEEEKDPDDFVYQPGKKTPKKKVVNKRVKHRTPSKRKRAPPAASKRSRKKAKVLAPENEPVPADNDETKTVDLNENQLDQAPAAPTTDVIESPPSSETLSLSKIIPEESPAS